MKKLFVLATAAVLFGTGIVGCSNTADGAAKDASNDTAAVAKGVDTAATKTVQGTEKAVATTEKAAVNAADATAKGVTDATAAAEKGVANAAATTEKAVSNTVATTEKGVVDATAGVAKVAGDAGQAVKHTGKVMTVTPTVKAALLKNETLYPTGNASLNSINVDTGSDGQTIILKGTVKTNDMKKLAEDIAKKASPDGSYKIQNELKVGTH